MPRAKLHRQILRLALVLVAVLPVAFGLAPASAAPDNARFGVNWIHPPSTVAGQARIDQAATLGARFDRFPFYWNEIQPSADGPFDYAQLDAVVAADTARGIAVQGILLGAPAWAVSGGRIDLDRWSTFVRQTVTRYKGTIRYWEIWNEPDLLDGNGRGRYWPYGVEAYYDLLRAGYRAAKAADPGVTVLMGALAFPHDNEGFFAQFLDVLGRDPTAPANNYYFDVLPFHSYDRVARIYDLPMGYFGKPGYEGFRAAMRRHGFEKPIWVNETGVPIWDYGSGKDAPGRATQDEQASYVVQSVAYAQAVGLERYFFFQFADDGAGAVDPATNQPAEYFGLISNAGQVRPAYTAYQQAIALFGDARLTTRVNTGRDISRDNSKGIEVITLYGTPRGKVTVAWNADGGAAKTVKVPAAGPSATQLSKLGQSLGTLAASDGAFTLTLPAATNNNNFDCYTAHGCDPDDYIIGGTPTILIENDGRVPPATINPLPSASNAPFAVSWRLTRPVPGVTFDVQYMDSADGVWRDWLTGVSTTEAKFGEGALKPLRGHTYQFRVRAKDAAGQPVDGYGYPVGGMASTVAFGGDVADGLAADAKIEIVWPHGNLPVDQATKVNLSAYLFNRGTTVSVGPSWNVAPRLYRSLNNGVEELVGTATKRLVAEGNLTFPAFDFNDVDVAAAREPKNRYYFRLAVGDSGGYSNTWSHGADARTYFPQTDIPTAVLPAGSAPGAVDAKIEIVWPHGSQPVDQATKANVGVYLFEHGTLKSVPVDYGRRVRLLRSLNNGIAEEVAVGERVLKTEGGLTFPTWQFNDVDVAAARDPNNRYYFRAVVEGVDTYSNTWAHGKDGRTIFPAKDVPSGVAP